MTNIVQNPYFSETINLIDTTDIIINNTTYLVCDGFTILDLFVCINYNILVFIINNIIYFSFPIFTIYFVLKGAKFLQ